MAAKPEIVFNWEKISTAMADGLEDLIAFNWSEIEAKNDEAPPLDIDWPRYAMLERAGIYRAISVRKASRLIGYNGYFVQPHLRHRTSLWAINDALFIDKDERKGTLGIKLVAESVKMLRSIGVKVVTQGDMLAPLVNSTTAKSHATFGDLLLRQGFKLVENLYVLAL
jgi:hypothetical protein